MAASSRSSRLPPGLVAAAVFAVAVVLLMLLLRGGDEGGLSLPLADYDPEAVEGAVREALTPVTLRPSRELRVTGRRIRWNDASGRPFLETPRITLSVRLGAAPDGGILLSEGVIVEPRLRLVQTGEERWNYEGPLAPLLAEERGDRSDAGGLAVRMRDMTITGGYVLIDLLEARYELRSLDVALSHAQLAGPALEAPVFNVRRANAELVLPDTAEGRLTRDLSIADARIRVLDGAVAFDVARGTFGSSQLAAIRGVWNPALGGYGLDLELTAENARLADLPWLPGQVPEGAAGSFRLRMQPRPGGRTALALTNIDFRAPGSRATGSLAAVIGGDSPVLETVNLRVSPLSLDLVEAFTGPLPYGGTVAGTIIGAGAEVRFDLEGQLTTPTLRDPFSTDIVGTVAFSDAGFALRDAAVTLDRVPLSALRQLAPGLPLTGPISGTVRLVGGPGEGPVELDVRFEAGGGVVLLLGTADLSGAVPAYDLTGRLTGVRLQAVLEPAVPPAEIHAEFAVAGRGTDPRTATATVAAQGRFTGWRSEAGDTLIVRGGLAGGVVDVADLRVMLGPISLGAAGRWDMVDGDGAIRYDLAVSDLGPLGPYLPTDASGERRYSQGSLRLSGLASGTVDRPALSGEAEARDFRWGEWAAESFDGEYSINLTDGLPRIESEISASRLRTPLGAFAAVEGRVDFGRPNFAVSLQARQEGDRGIIALEADGVVDESGQREIFVRSLELDLQRERWRLPDPGRIAWTAGDAVRVEGIELLQTSGDGRILLDGIVAPADRMDVTVDIAGLPVGDVLELVGNDMPLEGELALRGRVAGPADDPDVNVRVVLTDGHFRDVAIRLIETDLQYDDARLIVDGQGFLGDSARIEIDGSVPARIQLGGAPFFALVDEDPIDVQIITRTFPLSTLDPGLATVDDIEGRLEANVRVAGTPAAPRLSGSGQLLEGALTIPLLGRRFRNISGAVLLSGREARIREVVVQSVGTARVEGRLDFTQLTDPSLDLTASLDAFRFQDITNEGEAGLWGTVRLAGTLSRPVLTGRVRATDGAISLAPLQQPELSARLAGGDLALLDPEFDVDLGAPADGGGFIISSLTVVAGDNLWFVTEEARVRLNGTLTVDRMGEEMAIQGTLQGEGGTFELSAGLINRQFRIVSSEIQFFGSPDPNPRIDIVASRLVRVADGADVDVQVRVGGTLNTPTLSLGTATGSNVPESELLSFLLFGRPTSDLGQVTGAGGFEGALGQGLAYTGLAEVLFSELGEEFSFLDYVRVDVVPGVGWYATAGIEISNDLFLTTDFPIASDAASAAVALEWQTRFGTFRGGYEPVERLGRLGTRTLSYLELEARGQFIAAWRERWTY